MQYRRFGRTDLQVSLVGLGSGGPSQLGQKSGVLEADAARVVRRALDLGINLIDTSAAYGESEVILGRALKDVPRDRYVLATKFHGTGREAGGEELRPAGALTRSLDRSLQRLVWTMWMSSNSTASSHKRMGGWWSASCPKLFGPRSRGSFVSWVFQSDTSRMVPTPCSLWPWLTTTSIRLWSATTY